MDKILTTMQFFHSQRHHYFVSLLPPLKDRLIRLVYVISSNLSPNFQPTKNTQLCNSRSDIFNSQTKCCCYDFPSRARKRGKTALISMNRAKFSAHSSDVRRRPRPAQRWLGETKPCPDELRERAKKTFAKCITSKLQFNRPVSPRFNAARDHLKRLFIKRSTFENVSRRKHDRNGSWWYCHRRRVVLVQTCKLFGFCCAFWEGLLMVGNLYKSIGQIWMK